MTPDGLSRKVVTERSDWVREMLERLRALPLESLEDFGSYELCSNRLTDLEAVLSGLHRWIGDHADKIDSSM